MDWKGAEMQAVNRARATQRPSRKSSLKNIFHEAGKAAQRKGSKCKSGEWGAGKLIKCKQIFIAIGCTKILNVLFREVQS